MVYVKPDAGNDTANLYDGPGSDELVVAQPYTDLKYADNTYRVTTLTSGFEFVTATATVQGTDGLDRVTMYDGAGNDTFTGKRSISTMKPASGNPQGYGSTATGFEKVYGYTSTGYDNGVFEGGAGARTICT